MVKCFFSGRRRFSRLGRQHGHLLIFPLNQHEGSFSLPLYYLDSQAHIRYFFLEMMKKKYYVVANENATLWFFSVCHESQTCLADLKNLVFF